MTVATDAVAIEPQAPSIYQAIGGRPSVKAAVDGLYVRLFADPELIAASAADARPRR